MRNVIVAVLLIVLVGGGVGVGRAQDASPVASPAASASPGASPVGSPVSAMSFGPETQALLAQRAQTYLESCPGMVMYLDSPAGRFHQAFGFDSQERRVPLDPNARFQIGSNTKMMTAAIILQLQEEGNLSVDDPLSKWYPTESGKLSPDTPITISHLLTHTSGIYDYVPDFNTAAILELESTGSRTMLRQDWTPQQIIDYVVTHRASAGYFLPGAEGEWHYSNTNYILLGMVIEKVTGVSYAEALQMRIFGPLGMADTELVTTSPTVEQFGHGYWLHLDTTDWNLSQAWAAGGVVSTPQDMAIFLRALFRAQLFTDPGTLTAMQTIAVPTNDQPYGLGVEPFGSGTWGHNGQTYGTESAVAYRPQEDLVLVAYTKCALTNVGGMSLELENHFAD